MAPHRPIAHVKFDALVSHATSMKAASPARGRGRASVTADAFTKAALLVKEAAAEYVSNVDIVAEDASDFHGLLIAIRRNDKEKRTPRGKGRKRKLSVASETASVVSAASTSQISEAGSLSMGPVDAKVARSKMLNLRGDKKSGTCIKHRVPASCVDLTEGQYSVSVTLYEPPERGHVATVGNKASFRLNYMDSLRLRDRMHDEIVSTGPFEAAFAEANLTDFVEEESDDGTEAIEAALEGLRENSHSVFGLSRDDVFGDSYAAGGVSDYVYLEDFISQQDGSMTTPPLTPPQPPLRPRPLAIEYRPPLAIEYRPLLALEFHPDGGNDEELSVAPDSPSCEFDETTMNVDGCNELEPIRDSGICVRQSSGDSRSFLSEVHEHLSDRVDELESFVGGTLQNSDARSIQSGAPSEVRNVKEHAIEA